MFLHLNNRQTLAIPERDIQLPDGKIAPGAEEFRAGKGRTHFETGEASRLRGTFASVQEKRSNSAARPVRMNEKRTDFRGIMTRVAGLFGAA